MTTQARDYIPNKIRDWEAGLVYARDEYLDVHVMQLAVTHIATNDDDGPFTTVGHCLGTGPKGSGKSTLFTDIPRMLAFNPFSWSKDDTEPALQHAFDQRERVGGLVLDDVGKIFGDSGNAGKLSKVYSFIIKGYRRGATTQMSRNQVTVGTPCFTTVFMNGLEKAVPDDAWDRSIHYKNFRKAPSGYKLRDALSAKVHAEGELLKEALHSWATGAREFCIKFMQHDVHRIHPLLEGRRLQKWGPSFALAYYAGGEWPRRIFDAFLLMELDSGSRPSPVPEQKLLMDVGNVLERRRVRAIHTSDLIVALRELPESGLYKKSSDAEMKDMLFETLGESKSVKAVALYGPHKDQEGTAKGWQALPIIKAAIELHDMLYPPLEQMADDVDEEFAFTPTEA